MKDKPAKCVAAEQFQLVDSKGNTRALLTTSLNPDLPTLRLIDQEGYERVVVEITADNRVVVALLNKKGQTEIGLGSGGERRGIQVSDGTGPGIMLSIHPDGKRQIDVYNESGDHEWGCP